MHTSGKDTLTITSLAVAIKFQNIWGWYFSSEQGGSTQATYRYTVSEGNQPVPAGHTNTRQDFSRSYSESDLVILVILLCDTKI